MRFGGKNKTKQEANTLFRHNRMKMSMRRCAASSTPSCRLSLSFDTSLMTQTCAGCVVGDTHFGLNPTSCTADASTLHSARFQRCWDASCVLTKEMLGTLATNRSVSLSYMNAHVSRYSFYL